MDADTSEFYAAVCGVCNKNMILTVVIDGVMLADDLSVQCGLTTTETGDPSLECISCHRFAKPCECGNGVQLEFIGNGSSMICSNDVFCHRHKFSIEDL